MPSSMRMKPPCRYFTGKGKSPQSKSSMWLYRTSGNAESQIVLYDDQPDRGKEHLTQFLDGFQGYLHTDGYTAYHSLPDEIMIIGCWVHARRKFEEVLKGMAEKARVGFLAEKVKRYCDRLVALEKEIAKLSPEGRQKQRQKESKPLMEEFFRWLRLLNASTKSAFGNAAGYVLGQKKYLENDLLDGRLEISNNRAERSIKPFVIGRKNFLFANIARGAQACTAWLKPPRRTGSSRMTTSFGCSRQCRCDWLNSRIWWNS